MTHPLLGEMVAIYEFDGVRPVVHPDAFVHPEAIVTGDVVIGADCYIGPGCALRGDWGRIVIEAGCNVQENCVIHMFPGTTVTLREAAHVGHGAVIHGGTLGRNCLIGMNAVIMDNVVIGDGCIVGALCLVPSEMVVPDRKVVVGNPAKIVKDVSDEMLSWKTEGTRLYQRLPQMCRDSLRACEPLREPPQDSRVREADYATWKRTKKS